MDLFSKLKTMDILLIDDDEWIRDSLSMHLAHRQTEIKGIEVP